jgi:hypothetical protein
MSSHINFETKIGLFLDADLYQLPRPCIFMCILYTKYYNPSLSDIEGWKLSCAQCQFFFNFLIFFLRWQIFTWGQQKQTKLKYSVTSVCVIIIFKSYEKKKGIFGFSSNVTPQKRSLILLNYSQQQQQPDLTWWENSLQIRCCCSRRRSSCCWF